MVTAGRARHAFGEAAAELFALGEGVAVGGEVELVDEDVIGIEAGVHVQGLAESADEEACAYEGDEGEGNFASDERGADAAAACLSAAAGGVEARGEVEAADAQRGNEAGDDAAASMVMPAAKASTAKLGRVSM